MFVAGKRQKIRWVLSIPLIIPSVPVAVHPPPPRYRSTSSHISHKAAPHYLGDRGGGVGVGVGVGGRGGWGLGACTPKAAHTQGGAHKGVYGQWSDFTRFLPHLHHAHRADWSVKNISRLVVPAFSLFLCFWHGKPLVGPRLHSCFLLCAIGYALLCCDVGFLTS